MVWGSELDRRVDHVEGGADLGALLRRRGGGEHEARHAREEGGEHAPRSPYAVRKPGWVVIG